MGITNAHVRSGKQLMEDRYTQKLVRSLHSLVLRTGILVMQPVHSYPGPLRHNKGERET
jgi:hypothetical protein